MTEIHEQHPDDKEYVKIAAVLAVVTGGEVAAIYITSLQSLIRPILSVMMVFKFSLVALWFMHLKFDSRVFRRLFVLGILLALAVFTIVLVTFAAVERPGISG